MKLRKKVWKQVGSSILSVVLATSMLLSGSVVNVPQITTEVQAAQQDQMKMPIEIYDHFNDYLLFQYNMGVPGIGMSLYQTEMGENVAGAGAGEGLVATKLDPNKGTPVYTQAAVETAAARAKEIIEITPTKADWATNPEYTALFKDIVSKVSEGGTNTIVIDTIEGKNELNTAKTLEDMGWSFAQANGGSTTANTSIAEDKWNNAGGTQIWSRGGAVLMADVTDAANTATLSLTGLDAGTYRLAFTNKALFNFNVSGTSSTVTENGGDGYIEFTVGANGSATFTFTPNGSAPAQIINPQLIKDGAVVKNLALREERKSAADDGWVLENGAKWYQWVAGGIATTEDDNTTAYKTANVTSGKKYILSVGGDDGTFCDVWAANSGGTKIDGSSVFDASNNYIGSSTFTAPGNTVRVCVKNKSTAAGVRRVYNITLTEMPTVRLGSYAESKAKFDNGGSYDDITTCMDYAYYVLNNFWSDTNGDITEKSNAYKTLTLDYKDNAEYDDKYVFDHTNQIVYDVANGNISQDWKNKESTGLFPLDSAWMTGANTLSGKTGYGLDDELADDKGVLHNFHYGMKAHCQFLYDSTKNLNFRFKGDDDVYLFINGTLAMDLGGAHGELEKSIDINQLVQQGKLDLEDGEIYDFDFFYLERHTDYSRILIETNLPLAEAIAKADVVYKNENGQVIADGSTVQAGKKVNVEYTVESATKIPVSAPNKMQKVAIEDETLGVKIGKSTGIVLGDKAKVDGEIKVSVENDPNRTITISEADLADATKVAAFLNKLDALQVDNEEKIVFSGIYVDMPGDQVLKSVLNASAEAPQAEYSTTSGNVEFTNVPVSIEPADTKAIPVNTPNINVDGKLTDNNGNEYDPNQKLLPGTDVNVGYTLWTTAGDMTNLGFSDAGNGFAMNKNGITIPEGFDIPNGLTVTYKDVDNNEVTYTVSATDIAQNTGDYPALKTALGSDWKLKNGETVTVTGLHKAMADKEIKTNVTGTATGPKPTYNATNDTVTVQNTNVSATDPEVKVVPVNTVTVTFDAGNHGTIVGEPETQVYKYSDVQDIPEAADHVHVNNIPDVAAEQGYTFAQKWKKVGDNDPDKTYTANDIQGMTFDEDTTFIAQYDTDEYPYVVRYVDEQESELATQKHGSAQYGSDVEESYVPIEHYGLVDPNKATQTLNISNNEEDNVITFVYRKGQVNVIFDPKDHGTIPEGEGTKTIGEGEGIDKTPVDTPENGYTFEGWKMVGDDNPNKVYTAQEIEAMTFDKDTTFEAVYSSNEYDYVVKYVDTEGNPLHEPKTGKGTYGQEITEDAISIPHYGLQDPTKATQKITLDDGTNEIIFVYEKGKVTVTFDPKDHGTIPEGEGTKSIGEGEGIDKTPVDTPDAGYTFEGWKMVGDDNPDKVYTAQEIEAMTFEKDTTFEAQYKPIQAKYTVKYVDTEGKEIAESKTGTDTFGEDHTENAINIPQYGLQDSSKKTQTITMSANEEDNIITFVYEKGKVTVTFDPADNGTIPKGSESEKIDVGSGVTDVPKDTPNKGYEFTGWKKQGDDSDKVYTDDEIKNMTFDEDTTFVAQYEPTKVKYTVKYVDESGKPLADDKVVENVAYGTKVAENAIDITGYEPDKDTASITVDDETNEIVFVYKPKKYTVTYKTDGNGTLDGNDKETVNSGDHPTDVPKPQANEGYKFVGWTKTVKAGNSSVDDPSKEVITEDTVFTAVFEPLEPNFTVRYVDENGKEIFNSKKGYADVDKSITEKAVDIEGYELKDPNTKEQNLTITDNPDNNIITFVYKKVEEPTTPEPTTVPPTTKAPKETKKEKTTTKAPKETTKAPTTTKAPVPPAPVTNTTYVSPMTGHTTAIIAMFVLMLASIVVFGIANVRVKRVQKSKKRR